MTLNTNEVAAAAQVSLRQLQYWHEHGLVKPDLNYRHFRSFDKDSLFKTLLVAKMRSKAIPLQRIRKVLKSLHVDHVKPDSILIIRNCGSFRACTEDTLLRALDLENGPVYVVFIAPLIEILNREIRKRRTH
jgi:DNA-binding transcriptional MerR regulator